MLARGDQKVTRRIKALCSTAYAIAALDESVRDVIFLPALAPEDATGPHADAFVKFRIKRLAT